MLSMRRSSNAPLPLSNPRVQFSILSFPPFPLKHLAPRQDTSEIAKMQMDLMKVSKKQVQKQIKEMRKQMKNVPPEMRGMMAAMGGAAQDMALQMLDAAEAEVKKDPEASAKSMMEKFDVDGDGKVTKDEFLERANEVMFAGVGSGPGGAEGQQECAQQ